MRTPKIPNRKLFILIFSLFFRYLSTINKCLNGIFISKYTLYTAATRTWGDSACVTVHLPRLRSSAAPRWSPASAARDTRHIRQHFLDTRYHCSSGALVTRKVPGKQGLAMFLFGEGSTSPCHTHHKHIILLTGVFSE